MSLLFNLLALITAGYKGRRLLVRVKRSKLCVEVLNLLYSEGYIRGFSLSEKTSNELIVFLKYNNGKPAIRGFENFSTAGRRVYCKSSFILTKLVSNGLFVLSTSNHGLVTSSFLNLIRKNEKCGGELMFKILF